MKKLLTSSVLALALVVGCSQQPGQQQAQQPGQAPAVQQAGPAPAVQVNDLAQNIGKTVRLTGTVSSYKPRTFKGPEVTIRDDRGRVFAYLTGPADVAEGKAVTVEGKVAEPGVMTGCKLVK